MAANPYITGSRAQDLRQRAVTGRQVAGQGNVAARGVGYKAGDVQGEYASTHSMPAESHVTQAAGAGHDTYQASIYLSHILVTTLGTVELTIFDNAGPAGTATGDLIAIVPANAARGTIIDCRAPLKLGGFSAISGANTPGVTLFYA
jgi:autotransporter adhesin